MNSEMGVPVLKPIAIGVIKHITKIKTGYHLIINLPGWSLAVVGVVIVIAGIFMK